MTKRNGINETVKEFFTLAGADGQAYADLLTALCDEHNIVPVIYGSSVRKEETTRKVLDLHSIEIKNIKGTASRSINILPGVNLLYGPNDSGKSALLEGLAWVIGGPDACPANQDQIIRAGTDDAAASVTFTGGKVTRMVHRSMVKSGKRAGEVDVDSTLQVEIEGSREVKMRAATALLGEYLNVPFDLLRRSSLVSQGELASLLDEQPAKRREMFYQLLGLEASELTRQALAKVQRQLETQYVAQKQVAEQLADRLSSARLNRSSIDLSGLRVELATLQSKGAEAEVGIKAWLEQADAIKTKIEQAERANSDRSFLVSQINELNRSAVLTESAPDTSRDLMVQREAYQKQLSIVSRLQSELDQVKQLGLKIKNMPPVCPHCLELGWKCGSNEEVKEARLGQLREEHRVKAAEVKVEDDRLAALRAAVIDLENKTDRFSRLAKARSEVTAQINAKESALKALPAIPVEHIDAWRAEASTILNRVTAARQSSPEETAARRADVVKLISEGERLDREMEWLVAEVAKLGATVTKDHLKMTQDLVDAFGKSGIPLWLSRKHVSRINEIAAGLAEGDAYRYAFGPDLGIEIRSVNGNAVVPSLASGSSRQRGALVLRAALGRYLQEITGVECPVFWLDEVPFQDAANAHQVGEVVKRLTRWYPKVVFASSSWEPYIGQFDHEISLLPGTVVETTQELVAKLDELKAKSEAKLPPTRAESNAAFDKLTANIEAANTAVHVAMDKDADEECPF